MRMRELVEASGLPRTTVHHYQREGLLPAAEKTAPNAARYDDRHLERLRLIARLRRPPLGPLPLERVRAVIARVEAGVEPGLAAALETAAPPPGSDSFRPGTESHPASAESLSELARKVGLGLRTARALEDAGLLLPARSGGPYDAADVAVAGTCADLLERTDLHPGDLAPVAELVRELLRYERALGELAAAAGGGDERAEERRHAVAAALPALHLYLLRRGLRRAAEG